MTSGQPISEYPPKKTVSAQLRFSRSSIRICAILCLLGTTFGFSLLCLKFDHVSEAMSVFARVFGASCCDHFSDDYKDV